MPTPTKLNVYIEKIMHISVQRMGGAFAGILGTSGADSGIVYKLKKAAMSYAGEYTESTPNPAKLTALSQEMYGYLQTLQLTYTLTEEEAGKLIDLLQKLDDESLS